MHQNQLKQLSIVGLFASTLIGSILSISTLAQTTLNTDSLNTVALASHNSYRTRHKSPAMSLNNSVKATAQSWANTIATTGNFAHSSSTRRNGAGENLYAYYTTGTSIKADVLAKSAVDSWYNEVSKYNYSSPGFSMATGHFTQVVWKGSTALGCGAAQGTKTINNVKYNAFYVVCQYSPAGNIQGRFPQNVLQP